MALSTEKPRKIHCTKSTPRYKAAKSKFVWNLAPQNYVWPHSNTYPIKAVAFTRTKIINSISHIGV